MQRFWKRKAAHLRLGERGEKLACRLLFELGYDGLVCNFRGHHGEVDIIARLGTLLCFVEVKTRHRMRYTTKYGRPRLAVGKAKRKKIIRTAKQYLREIGSPPLACRYDIVEVIFDGRRLAELTHLKRAFREPKKSGHPF